MSIEPDLMERLVPHVESLPADAAEQYLRRAAEIEAAPTPAMLRSTARWIDLIDRLHAAGFSTDEVFQVVVGVDRGELDVPSVSGGLLLWLMEGPEGARRARASCDLHVGSPAPRPQQVQRLINVSLARLAREGALADSDVALLGPEPLERNWARAIVEALPASNREAVVLALVPVLPEGPGRGFAAARSLNHLLDVFDLVPTEAVRSRRDALLAAAASERSHAALAAEIASGVARQTEALPTTRALKELELELEALREDEADPAG